MALGKKNGAPYISVQIGTAIVSIGTLMFLLIISLLDAVN